MVLLVCVTAGICVDLNDPDCFLLQAVHPNVHVDKNQKGCPVFCNGGKPHFGQILHDIA